MNSVTDTFQGEIAILGDFNINYNFRHTPAFKTLKEFERNFNLKQIITSPTRVVKNSKMYLDLIFTNMDHVISSGVLDIAISDHLPVFLIKKKQKIKHTYTQTKGRTYKTYCKDSFQNDMKTHQNWAYFWEIEENNPEKIWDSMFEIILDCANEHAPVKDMKIREDTPNFSRPHGLTKSHTRNITF